MNKYISYKDDAIKKMKLADHLLTMTYPIVQDPKLLKIILKNLYLSLKSTIMYMLCYEGMEDKVKTNNFNIMLDSAKSCFRKHNISQGYIGFMEELHSLVKKQNDADVEFIRKEKFVFASKDYKLNIVNKKEMKDYIIKGKLFMNEILGVIP